MVNTVNTVTDLGFGINLIDTGFQRPDMAACYVMQQVDTNSGTSELAIIETGTKDTVPHILNFLAQNKFDLEQVKYVVVTHVHLDHAGGAGLLMRALPNAKLVVHEKGARHMIDPSKLQAGATAVYGKTEFNKTYGDLLAIPEAQIVIPKDGEVLELAGRKLTFIDTPGHARHHFCVFDELSQGFFTGDTFGLAYQELTNKNGPFIFPTTTPVQFDPDALHASIDKMMAFKPQRMFLTHYSVVENPAPLSLRLHAQVNELVAIAQGAQQAAGPARVQEIFAAIMDMLLAGLVEHGCELPLEKQKRVIQSDAFLNAQGLDIWLSNKASSQ